MNTETKKVDVVAVMDACIAKRDLNLSGMAEARAAVAELIEAVKENRIVAQDFANDGKPENYFRYEASERRVMEALARVGGAS